MLCILPPAAAQQRCYDQACPRKYDCSAALKDGEKKTKFSPPGVTVAQPEVREILSYLLETMLPVPICALFLHGADDETPHDLATTLASAATMGAGGVEAMEDEEMLVVEESIAGTSSGGGRPGPDGKGNGKSKGTTLQNKLLLRRGRQRGGEESAEGAEEKALMRQVLIAI